MLQKPTPILEDVSDEERIALLTFHPTWFVRYCIRLLGRKEALEMLEANMQTSPTYIRLNTLKADEHKILEKLIEKGIELEKVGQLKHNYRVLSATDALIRAESFKDGFFYIQDKASCFVAEASDPKPGMIVLDVCAAPGAKTTYLAQLMHNKGVIYSIDYSRRRMNVWKNEIGRMGVEIAVPIITDAYNPLPLRKEADLVVLDPPCTSTGAFRKLPSAKWRFNQHSVQHMAWLSFNGK